MPSDRPYPLRLPRHAVSPRQVARAGDVWRLFQEAAVQASSDAGYPPSRYTEEQIAFIVGQMTVEHHRELVYGEDVHAWTWIRRNLRGTIAQRELRLETPLGLLASASQRWVHVSMAGGAPRPCRGGPGVQAAFAPTAGRDAVEPRGPRAPASCDGAPGHCLRFPVWHGWMDALGHVNHPVYIDWADEALRHWMAASGLDPQGLVPIWEDVRFRQAAVAGDAVRVETWAAPGLKGAVSLAQRVVREADDALLAEIRSERRSIDGAGSLARALGLRGVSG